MNFENFDNSMEANSNNRRSIGNSKLFPNSI